MKLSELLLLHVYALSEPSQNAISQSFSIQKQPIPLGIRMDGVRPEFSSWNLHSPICIMLLLRYLVFPYHPLVRDSLHLQSLQMRSVKNSGNKHSIHRSITSDNQRNYNEYILTFLSKNSRNSQISLLTNWLVSRFPTGH